MVLPHFTHVHQTYLRPAIWINGPPTTLKMSSGPCPSNHSCQWTSGGPLPVALQIIFPLSARSQFESLDQVTLLQLYVKEETFTSLEVGEGFGG